MKKILIFSGMIIVALILMSSTLDLDFLFNYEAQNFPEYITKNNGADNPITDEAATLGRVLFYDKNLSSNNTIACASCHIQEFAFGDTSAVSLGVNGVTGRHSMRLVNARFAEEGRFFWDERAGTLEQQTTMPVRDHAEMGYSGINGDPSFNDLLVKLSLVEYYDDLFYFVYGDTEITEERIQESIAQFVRSIQSFDSKYDEGLAEANGDLLAPFTNFTAAENRGKQLFMDLPDFDSDANRIGGGAGCNSCHRAPEFDIDPVSRTNGITSEINGDLNFNIHRSPTLRDIFHPITEELNGPLMHNAQFIDMESVINHYANLGNNLPISEIAQLDTRFRVGPNAQKLNLTDENKNDMVSFMKTLSGNNLYVDERWSDPFDLEGGLTILSSPLTISNLESNIFIKAYPNPVIDYINIRSNSIIKSITLYDCNGHLIKSNSDYNQNAIILNLSTYPKGTYLLSIQIQGKNDAIFQKLIKM